MRPTGVTSSDLLGPTDRNTIFHRVVTSSQATVHSFSLQHRSCFQTNLSSALDPMMERFVSIALLLLSSGSFSDAFMTPAQPLATREIATPTAKSTVLQMGLDMVTYMRVEWISAALVTNQTPRSADVCLQLGCEDGRAVTFVPRTIDKLITSTVEADGMLPVAIERQLKQQEKSRNAGRVQIANQRADDLKETPDDSVDVVISLAACERMIENGLDWKKKRSGSSSRPQTGWQIVIR